MKVSNEEKLVSINQVVDRLYKLGSRFEELLEGFKLYDQYKGSLDIEIYEQALTVFADAIEAMEEQMRNYNRLFSKLKELLEQ